MKRIIIFFIFIIAIVMIAIPFYMSTVVNEKISIGSNLLGALSSLVTLLIAVLLYSKYGIEKTVLNKQIEVALRFLEELKKTKFVIRGDRVTLFLSLDHLRTKHFKDYYNKELLFGRSYINGLNPLWQFGENIFLPKAIAEKLNLLQIEVIVSCKREDKHMKIDVRGYSCEGDEMLGIINNKSITLNEYISIWEDVIKTSREWIDKYSNVKEVLNFDKN